MCVLQILLQLYSFGDTFFFLISWPFFPFWHVTYFYLGHQNRPNYLPHACQQAGRQKSHRGIHFADLTSRLLGTVNTQPWQQIFHKIHPHRRVQAITDFNLHEIRVSWPCRKNFQLSSFSSPSPPALPTPDHQYRDTFLCAALPSTLSLVCAHEQKETWSSFGFWTHCQLEMWYQWTSQEHLTMSCDPVPPVVFILGKHVQLKNYFKSTLFVK